MEKGKFYKIVKDWTVLFRLDLEGGKNISLSPSGNYKIMCDMPDIGDKQEITDFVNKLCFEIIKTRGYEYNPETNSVCKVTYCWDINLIPGEKFFGVKIQKILGNEESWYDMISGRRLLMSFDILRTYDFRERTLPYIGLYSDYQLYLPYTEEYLDIYQKYIDNAIRFIEGEDIETKIKI